MKKIIFIGRSECGKTTLTQALKGEKIQYQKTQYINNDELMVDTPGEYIQTKHLGGAIALYAYESDIVGLLLSATEPFSLYPPNVTCMVNREVIGIVTQIDQPNANPERAERWLRLCGCKTIFKISSVTGEGIDELRTYILDENNKNSQKQKKTQKSS